MTDYKEEYTKLVDILDTIKKLNLVEQISWDVVDEQVIFHVTYNDFFEKEDEGKLAFFHSDLPLLLECVRRVDEINKHYKSTGVDLFLCRMMKKRPHGEAYRFIREAFWPLFDACGPEREVNEKCLPHPGAKKEKAKNYKVVGEIG